MNKIIIAVVIILIGAFAIYKFKQPGSSSDSDRARDTYYSGAFAFKAKPLEKLGLAAKILNVEVTHDELTSRSPVLSDLATTKQKILTTAIKQKVSGLSKSNKKPHVVVYLEKPSPDFQAKSTNYSLEFSKERPKNTLVKINDTNYSRQELPLNQVHYSQVDTKIFAEKLRILADLYTKQLLLKISKANNTTIQGFINKTILTLPLKEVSDTEVKSFALSKNIVLTDKDISLKNRLRNIVKERNTKKSIENYIRSNHSDELGEIYFYPPSLKIPLYADKAIIGGKESDPKMPTFMVFSQLKCHTCSQLADNLTEIREKYKNKIRIGFVHFSADNDWRDNLAAQASFCLNLQSNDAFWDFFTKYSKTNKEITETLIMETAKSTGVNFENFSKCFVAQTYKEDVTKQVKYATDLGVTIAPTIIYDTQVLTGNILKRQLVNAIEASLIN